MKQIIKLIFVSFTFISLTSIGKSDKNEVLKLAIDYTKNWKYRPIKKFNNYWAIELINKSKDKRFSDVLADTLKPFEIFSIDTISLNDKKYLYSEVIKSLNKQDNKRIKNQDLKWSVDNGTISYSSPIFSIDNKSAIVYVVINCGSLCGSGEPFFFTKKEDEWTFSGRGIGWIS